MTQMTLIFADKAEASYELQASSFKLQGKAKSRSIGDL